MMKEHDLEHHPPDKDGNINVNDQVQQSSMNSIEYDDAKWSSVSLLSKVSRSVVFAEEFCTSSENIKRHGCTCFLSRLLQSILLCGTEVSNHNMRAPHSPSVMVAAPFQNEYADKVLYFEALEEISLLHNFLEETLLQKLKPSMDQIHFPATALTISGSDKPSSHSLPTAKIWAAAYLLKLFCDHPTPEEPDVNNNTGLLPNLNQFRKSLMNLSWKVETTRKSAYQFLQNFEEFTSPISAMLKDILTLLSTSTFGSNPEIKQITLADDSLSDFNFKQKSKEKMAPIVLEVGPALNLKSPLHISIVTKASDDCLLNGNPILPRDFSKFPLSAKQKVIEDLIRSVQKSVESIESVLSSSRKLISGKGIIKRCDFTGKPMITCHSSAKLLKSVMGKLIAAKVQPATSLNRDEEDKLTVSFSRLLKTWNEYVKYGQSAILKFYELADMTGICYSFGVHYIGINMPELGRLQKEIDLTLCAHSKKMCSCRCQCGKAKMKGFVLSSLIEDCDKKALEELGSTSSKENGANAKKKDEIFLKQMTSTWYHIILQQDPIEMEDLFGRYQIFARSLPDLEKLDSDMVLSSENISVMFKTGKDNSSLESPQISTLECNLEAI